MFEIGKQISWQRGVERMILWIGMMRGTNITVNFAVVDGAEKTRPIRKPTGCGDGVIVVEESLEQRPRL